MKLESIFQIFFLTLSQKMDEFNNLRDKLELAETPYFGWRSWKGDIFRFGSSSKICEVCGVSRLLLKRISVRNRIDVPFFLNARWVDGFVLGAKDISKTPWFEDEDARNLVVGCVYCQIKGAKVGLEHVCADCVCHGGFSSTGVFQHVFQECGCHFPSSGHAQEEVRRIAISHFEKHEKIAREMFYWNNQVKGMVTFLVCWSFGRRGTVLEKIPRDIAVMIAKLVGIDHAKQ